MQRLIAIVLPEPVAILIASRGRFGSPGWISHAVRGELEEILQDRGPARSRSGR